MEKYSKWSLPFAKSLGRSDTYSSAELSSFTRVKEPAQVEIAEVEIAEGSVYNGVYNEKCSN